jgi:hypothetical protein
MPGNQKTNLPPETEGSETEENDPPPKKGRTAAPGKRKRRDNGPTELAVEPVPPPTAQELGTLTKWTTEILAGGPRALIAAEHKAADLAQKFGIEIEKAWCLKTPYITQLEDNGQHDAARFALAWRPRYLSVLSLSGSDIFASRAAKVSNRTPRRHREADPEFAQQCEDAHQYAIQLLHDVTMKSAIEGECEPVLWQGIPVAWVRKVDNRLRIEMLRAHMPKTFKTPGSKVAINTGTMINGNVAIVDHAEQDRLIGLRQEALRKMAERKGLPVPTATIIVESA